MRYDQTVALAAFTGSLSLAGIGLGLVIRSGFGRRREVAEYKASVAETRRLLRAAALEERLRRLERLAATHQGKC